ncbi:uncharacterized protein LOC123555671 [Mercenaria mercenaria]|uniref:uncharacterized protein LOC123555671 n=1 Tax=Mercenaria mercenaria TaxID=6596 RepID=UPI00234FA48E|nr:uncharacterized protein LOC123555671 [Mercenaria mercenaria]
MSADFFFSVLFALFVVSISAKPSLDDVVHRLIEVETKLKESENEITFLRQTTILQKKIIENQEIRIQSLETEAASQRDIINADREKAAVTNREIKGLRNKLRTLLNKVIPFETSLKQEKTSLKNKIRSSDQNNVQLPRQAIGGGIAFTAYLDHDADYGADQTLKYNKIITNDGNGYNYTHSRGVCSSHWSPQRGMCNMLLRKSDHW